MAEKLLTSLVANVFKSGFVESNKTSPSCMHVNVYSGTYLDIILSLETVVLVLQEEGVVPLKLREVNAKMQPRSTLDSFCYCTYRI